jgi:hypothetical protein
VIRGEEHYFPALVRHAEDEHLALETRDTLRRKVDDGDDLAAHKPFRSVVRGELGARPPGPDFGPEVDGQFDRGFPGFGKGLCLDHLAHPQVFRICTESTESASGCRADTACYAARRGRSFTRVETDGLARSAQTPGGSGQDCINLWPGVEFADWVDCRWSLIATTGPAGAEDSRAACLVPRKVETSGGQVGV